MIAFLVAFCLNNSNLDNCICYRFSFSGVIYSTIVGIEALWFAFDDEVIMTIQRIIRWKNSRETKSICYIDERRIEMPCVISGISILDMSIYVRYSA